jgi:hypothetical protein
MGRFLRPSFRWLALILTLHDARPSGSYRMVARIEMRLRPPLLVITKPDKTGVWGIFRFGL